MGALLVRRQPVEGGEDHVPVLLPGLVRSRTERRDRFRPALLRRDPGGEQPYRDACASQQALQDFSPLLGTQWHVLPGLRGLVGEQVRTG